VADAFVSYSHRDEAFVAELVAALKSRGKQTWVDHEDIVPAAQWSQEIEKGITESDAFIFVISPDSVASSECLVELEHAVVLPKRIVPVVARETPDAEVPDELRSLHWLQFPGQEFASTVDRLVEVLDTDIEHLHLHTKLLVRAGEWEARGHDRSALLRGRDLDEAEQWQAEQTDRKPEPTPGQLQLILASRKAAVRRQRTSVLVGVIAVVVLAGLSAYALVQQHAAVIQRDTAQSRYLASQAQSQLQSDPQLSLILALRAYDTAPTTQAEAAVRSATAASDVRAILPGVNPTNGAFSNGNAPSTLPPDPAERIITPSSFDPTGRWIVSFNDLGTVEVWKWGARSGLGSSSHPYLLDLRSDRALQENGKRGLPVLSDVSFYDNGKGVLIGAYKGILLGWDWRHSRTAKVLGTGFPLPVFDADGGQVTAYDPMTRDLAVYDLHTRSSIDLPVGVAPYTPTVFSPDDGLLAVGTSASTIEVWNLKTDQLVRTYMVPMELVAAGTIAPYSFSPDDTRMAVTANNGTIEVFNLTTSNTSPTSLAVLPAAGHPLVADQISSVSDLVWSPNGQELAAGTEGSVIVWFEGNVSQNPVYLNSAVSLTRSGVAVGTDDRGIAFSPNGQYVATGSVLGEEEVWDWNASQSPTIPSAGSVAMIASPKSGDDLVAVDGDNGVFGVWDWQDEAWLAFSGVVPGTDAGFADAEWTPDGKFAAGTNLTANTFSVSLWNPQNDQRRASLSLIGGSAFSSSYSSGTDGLPFPVDLSFSSDGADLTFLAPGEGSSVNLVRWDWESAGPAVIIHDVGNEVVRNGSYASNLALLGYGPGGKIFLISGRDLLAWNGSVFTRPVVVSRNAVPSRAVLSAYGMIGQAVFLSGDTQILETNRTNVWLVNDRTGAERSVLADYAVSAIATAPEHARAAFFNGSGLVAYWDRASGTSPALLPALIGAQPSYLFTSISLSANGNDLAVSDGAGTRVYLCQSFGPFADVLAAARSHVYRQLTPTEQRTYLQPSGGN